MQPGDIARERIDFEVHALSRPRLAKAGMRQRVRDDVDAEAVGLDLVDRQADPVERDRSLWRDKRHQRRRRLDHKAHRLALRPAIDDARDAIDMARHDMPAEFVADPQARVRD